VQHPLTLVGRTVRMSNYDWEHTQKYAHTYEMHKSGIEIATATVGEKASREKRMHSCAETAADILLNDEGFTFSRG